MMSKLALLSLLSSAASLNIVAKGPTLRKAAATGASTVSMPGDKLAKVFKTFDTDGNGWLDESELKAAFAAVGQPADAATIHHSFTILDKNHDGKITLDEFKEMASQNVVPSLAEMSMRDNNHVFEDASEAWEDYATSLRDERMAKANPKKYCVDRCLATGYCEVLEDILDMTTQQVKRFCDNCSGEDECELSYA
jgi:hypothetical protein